MYIMYVCIKQA